MLFLTQTLLNDLHQINMLVAVGHLGGSSAKGGRVTNVSKELYIYKVLVESTTQEKATSSHLVPP